MHNKTWALALCALTLHAARAADDPPAPVAASPASAAASAATSSTALPDGGFCLYPGSPPSNVRYHSMGRVKLGKGTYGGVRDELPAFVAEARAKGAEAITNYNGAQRFGFWPWRLVRPVLTGIAIKYESGTVPDCVATGGTTLATVMDTNVEPARH